MTADPQDRRELAELVREAIDYAIDAIGTLSEDALGRDPEEGWPYRDELLARLRHGQEAAALLRQPSEGREPDGWIDVHDTRVRITDGAVAVTLHKRRSGHATVPVYIGAAPTPEPERCPKCSHDAVSHCAHCGHTWDGRP
jgi:hypothetical protein